MYYLGKFEEQKRYGGPEEGGWWYDYRYPCWKFGIPLPENLLYKIARFLNEREYQRRKKENHYQYGDYHSYTEDYYTYGLSDFFRLRETERPHYE